MFNVYIQDGLYSAIIKLTSEFSLVLIIKVLETSIRTTSDFV